MSKLEIIVDPEHVNEYLREHHLEEESVPIVAVLLQPEAMMPSGRAAVLLVVQLRDGRKVVAKTSINLFTMALATCRGTLQRLGLWSREQQD